MVCYNRQAYVNRFNLVYTNCYYINVMSNKNSRQYRYADTAMYGLLQKFGRPADQTPKTLNLAAEPNCDRLNHKTTRLLLRLARKSHVAVQALEVTSRLIQAVVIQAFLVKLFLCRLVSNFGCDDRKQNVLSSIAFKLQQPKSLYSSADKLAVIYWSLAVFTQILSNLSGLSEIAFRSLSIFTANAVKCG